MKSNISINDLVIWLTGLPGSGKTTISTHLEKELNRRNIKTIVLDGDKLRDGINSDLGFSPADRAENIRRVIELARLFSQAEILTITAFISPYKVDRDKARLKIGNEKFIEVFVDSPLEVCEKRDPKGMYAKARKGVIPDFTGVSAPYEPPVDPEVHLITDQCSIEVCCQQVLDFIFR